MNSEGTLPPAQNLRDAALEQLDTAHAHLSGAPNTLHHGIHQARKSVRRVRAALALASGKLGPAAERLDAELQRWCRGLSHLRDAQALIEALARFDDADFATPADKQRAIAHAKERRDAMLLRALARDPGFVARRRRLERARAILAGLPWRDVDREDAVAMLARSDRRVTRARRRADKHPDRDKDWHRLRRRVRRVRQMRTLMGPAFGLSPASAASSEAVANALGLAQDDALVLRACRSSATFPTAIRRALRVRAAERVEHARR